MVTHDEVSAATVSHRIFRLFDGKIINEEIVGRLS